MEPEICSENYPFARFLENSIKTLFENNPKRIAICALLDDGNVMTGYYKCDAQDKAIFAHNISADAMLDMVINNIGMIKDALEQEDL